MARAHLLCVCVCVLLYNKDLIERKEEAFDYQASRTVASLKGLEEPGLCQSSRQIAIEWPINVTLYGPPPPPPTKLIKTSYSFCSSYNSLSTTFLCLLQTLSKKHSDCQINTGHTHALAKLQLQVYLMVRSLTFNSRQDQSVRQQKNRLVSLFLLFFFALRLSSFRVS